MDALELRLSLIEQLKTIDDVKLLTQIKNLINIATEKKETRYPAQMTLEELKEVLNKSREDFKHGRYMTTEELRKRNPLCEKILPSQITPLPYLTTFTDSTVKRARPQLSVYTTNYWILPNLYVFFHKPDLSNLY